MKMRKWTIILGVCMAAAVFTWGCGTESAEPQPGQVLMEKAVGTWTEVIYARCGIADFGKPVGTVKETLKEEKDCCTVTFEIDETMSQQLVDGYAQSVWRACEKAGAGSNRSSSGYVYDDMSQAAKQQEPLNYYIWYYTVAKQKYRLGIYSTNMEEGRPGGLVLKIEKW